MSDDTESHESNERSTNRTGNCAKVFMAVLLIYVLSPGPVGWGLEKIGGLECLETAYSIFYAPLIFLDERVEFVSKFYNWQGRLFDF